MIVHFKSCNLSFRHIFVLTLFTRYADSITPMLRRFIHFQALTPGFWSSKVERNVAGSGNFFNLSGLTAAVLAF